MRPPACECRPGVELVNRYVVGARLGRGGHGTVFRAWDRRLGRAIAIKVFDPARMGAPRQLASAAREVRLARAVRHLHVCRVFDLVHAEGQWFMTMELAAGTLNDDLTANARRHESPAWAERARDARGVCQGLAALHRHGITHGDLKPSNILRMNDGRLTLADFGLARGAGEEPVTQGGTLNYLPPEVALGVAPDPRADLWQLGVVLHEILLGTRPRWKMTDAGPIAVLPTAFEPPAEIAALLGVAGRCLAWNPALRPTSAEGILPPTFL